jgi:hypothetical protein
MMTVSPPLGLHSWQGWRILALLCALAFLDFLVAFGVGPVFVAVTTAANAGVGPSRAGLAAAILNTSQQLGGALGLAIFSAVGTAQVHRLLGAAFPCSTPRPPASALRW